ncbi:hypothetical protein GCK72_007498 [Caenorhabditis remanei]|uniref:BTB domain-containing protein n=1 Tax=Caenorhabditis remanei TaxID=31234 RepID=A0A6A5HJ99_CAERE|nr:hypothetical protein GCK72_007498 [Caenorhabditis remanei]KAF1767539.1 hypothetical protein GCK72_007498 [Caenorhabditis remanei]
MSEENDETSPNNNEQSDSTPKCRDEKLNASDSTIQSVHKMCQELLEKQNTLETSISEIVGKLSLAEENYKKSTEDLQEKLDSIRSEMNEINQTLKPEVSSKMEESDCSADITASVHSIQSKTNRETMSTFGKFFVLKHKFKSVSSMKGAQIHIMEEEEHFGVPWQLSMKRSDGYLSFFLICSLLKDTEKKKEIEVECELKIWSPNFREKKQKFCGLFKSHGVGPLWGVQKFIEWEKLEKDFVVDDCFYAEIAVKVRKMTGIYKENLRSFDDTMEKFSDALLIVNDRKFYVLKLYLAAHSPYFEALFLGQFNESKKSEIKLSGVDSDDFQKYLEVLYAEQSIDGNTVRVFNLSSFSEFTVEGILMVADMYETPLVIRKCEEFLVGESEKTLKKRLELSTRYNLEALKNKCLSEIESIADLKSVIPGDIHDLDASIMAELLKKSLALH